jgi:hypothetical protein
VVAALLEGIPMKANNTPPVVLYSSTTTATFWLEDVIVAEPMKFVAKPT